MRILTLAPALLLASLVGCGSTPTSNPGSGNTALNISGNWQIQTAGTQTSSNTILLLGALTSNGTQVTGNFKLSNLVGGNFCGALNQLVTATGTLDTSQTLTQSVTLTGSLATGAVLTAQLTFPTVLTGTATGTLQVAGSSCPVPSAQAIAVEYQPLSGTYSGALTPSTIMGNSAVAGTGTLVLSQASTPATDGTFATTGTLTLVAGTCTQTTAFTGSVNGPILSLSSTSTGLPISLITLSAIDPPVIPATAQLAGVNLLYFPAPCNATAASTAAYTGNLTKK